jgi:hypothetical protein
MTTTEVRSPPESLGEPQLRLAGLSIWVHGRAHAEDAEEWAAGWLGVTLRCDAPGACVWVTGPLLRTSDLEDWSVRLVELLESEEIETDLDALDSNLSVHLQGERRRGLVDVAVQISAEPDRQHHRMAFTASYAEVSTFLADCRAVLGRSPPR